jgi:glutamate-1-semialdehyde 2,1-aminomutase
MAQVYLSPDLTFTRPVKRDYSRSLALRHRAHRLIPGGCHTYAKGDDQYPEKAPAFISRGQGCHVWDADGNEFIEYGMGLRAVTLGHAYEPVLEAAYRQMLLGANFTRPASVEIEAAERVLEVIDGADMVKFAKNGSDVTTAAVKLARAYTGRDLIAICKDQP